MKLSEYCKTSGVEIPLVIIGKIEGYHPNYLSQLWRDGEIVRVKNIIESAECKFNGICHSKFRE
jgi:hypothetical protein